MTFVIYYMLIIITHRKYFYPFASIAIEINPVDAAGAATKKRGIVIRSSSELDQFNFILTDQKPIELIRRIDEINPKQKEEVGSTGSDVFEI
jgi:hypothetical protein